MTTPANVTIPTSPLAAIPASALSTFSTTFGAALIGTFVAAALWGIACSQAYSYYNNYVNDGLWLKWLVALVLIFDTAHIVMSCATEYYYLISSAFNFSQLLKNYWAVNASVAFRIIITMLYYAYFIPLAVQLTAPRWRYPIALVTTIPALAYLGVGIFAVVRLFERHDILAVEAIARSTLLPFGLLQVIADLVLAIVLCVVLHRNKPAFKRTKMIIVSLTLLTISRGILTVIGALVTWLPVVIAPSQWWYMAAEYVQGSLYANSMLVTLNLRNKILEKKSNSSFAVPLSYVVPAAESPARRRSLAVVVPNSAGERERDSANDSMSQIAGKIPTTAFPAIDGPVDIQFVSKSALDGINAV